MQARRLGREGPSVSALGLGCMGLSGSYGAVERGQAHASLRAALDAGITLFDTGDFYGIGDNELLLAEVLRGRLRQDVVLSVKFGMHRGPDGRFLGVDGRPDAMKTSLAYSLRRLGTDYVDVYRLARVDPAVPIEETVGAIADMVEAGYVRHIGLSEAGVETIRAASSVHSICDVQIEYSLASRGIEARILPACRELGIGITAYRVLSRGLLSGRWRADRAIAPGDIRTRFPRFDPQNLDGNLARVEALRKIADARGASVVQLAFAWVLSRGEDIVPLVGAKDPGQLADAVDALSLSLERPVLSEIEHALPADSIAGTRYDAQQMRMLDSER